MWRFCLRTGRPWKSNHQKNKYSVLPVFRRRAFLSLNQKETLMPYTLPKINLTSSQKNTLLAGIAVIVTAGYQGLQQLAAQPNAHAPAIVRAPAADRRSHWRLHCRRAWKVAGQIPFRHGRGAGWLCAGHDGPSHAGRRCSPTFRDAGIADCPGRTGFINRPLPGRSRRIGC